MGQCVKNLRIFLESVRDTNTKKTPYLCETNRFLTIRSEFKIVIRIIRLPQTNCFYDKI